MSPMAGTVTVPAYPDPLDQRKLTNKILIENSKLLASVKLNLLLLDPLIEAFPRPPRENASSEVPIFSLDKTPLFFFDQPISEGKLRAKAGGYLWLGCPRPNLRARSGPTVFRRRTEIDQR